MKIFVATAAIVVALTLPTQADAAVLSSADRAELVALLANAHRQQGVCYSWNVSITDQNNRAGSTRDYGDHLNRTARPAIGDCPKAVTLDGQVVYTSEGSESEDYGSYQIRTVGLPPLRGTQPVSQTAFVANPDEAVFQAMSALPALVAESGGAPWMTVEANTAPLPPGAGPTDTPGSDWLRSNVALVTVLVLGILGSVLWILKLLFSPRLHAAMYGDEWRGRRYSYRTHTHQDPTEPNHGADLDQRHHLR